MAYIIGLAFASGFLLIFGLNLLYSELRSEGEKERRAKMRQEERWARQRPITAPASPRSTWT